LGRNYPLPFLISIDNGFKSSDPYSFEKKQDGRLVWKQYSGLVREYHAMVLCGYDDQIHAFKVLNSWGEKWGNKGYIWIDYDFFNLALSYWNGHPEIYLASPLLKSDISPSVKIGNQVWMSKNLNVSTYRNGDIIPEIKDPILWARGTTGGWCYYLNNPAYGAVFGKLYNSYAVNDPRGLAPAGWHIPNKAEVDVLINNLGGWQVAGGKLKSTFLWQTPNIGATNTSGFNALPAGGRDNDLSATFIELGRYARFYTSTASQGFPDNDHFLMTFSGEYGIVNSSGNSGYQRGYSVRCVKD
jgi:uncharacterized protein (TIGR02145 family)